MSRAYDVVNCEAGKLWRSRIRRKRRKVEVIAWLGRLTMCATRTILTQRVSMHYFPKNEAVRQKWIKFVRRHRKDFMPSNSFVLCSVHFKDSCFEHRPIAVPRENGEFIQLKKGLISESIPPRDTVMPHSSSLTSRKRRRVSNFTCCTCSN